MLFVLWLLLTCLASGFLQLYHLQSDSDVGETWRDLASHGYNTELKQVGVEKARASVPQDPAGGKDEEANVVGSDS